MGWNGRWVPLLVNIGPCDIIGGVEMCLYAVKLRGISQKIAVMED